MNHHRSLTASFSFVQFAYWIAYCGICSYAVIYLQELGFDNFSFGIVMALGNVFAALLGPLLASYLDRHPSKPTAGLNFPVYILELLLVGLLFIHAEHDLLTAVIYTLLITVEVAVYSVILRFCSDSDRAEIGMNFGVGRAFGSFGYILPTVFLGWLFTKISPVYLPCFLLAFVLLQILANWVIGRQLKNCRMRERVGKEKEEKGDSLITFLRNEPRFALLLLGSILIFFGYETYGKFTINIVRNVGGDTATMGVLTGYTAAIEIPVLCAYFLLRRKWKSSKLLRFSYLFFSIRAFLVAIAASVPQLYLAVTLQIPSYALYVSASVDYISEVIPAKNAGKAQSLAFTSSVLSVVLGSVISGKLFDIASVRLTMFICFVASVLGTVLAGAGVKLTE